MDEHALEYRWYLLGCERLGNAPLSEEEFEVQHARYQRCDRIVREYEQQSPEFSRLEALRVKLMLNSVRRERDLLVKLERAVALGQAFDSGDGGAGVHACIPPRLPDLTGAAAKLPPYLDLEPEWRNP